MRVPENNLGLLKVTNRLIAVAAWACLVFIVFATLSPIYLRPSLTATEPNFVVMFERIGAFAVLGSLFLISYPKRPVFVFVIVFGTAIVLELAQIFIPTRDARRRV